MWGPKKRHWIISIIPDCGTLHPGASLSFSPPLSTSKAQSSPAGLCVAGMELACQNRSLVWVKGGGRVNGDQQSTDRNSWSTKGACLTDLPAPSPAAPQNCSVTMRPWCSTHKKRINKPPTDKGYSYIKPLLQCGCFRSAPAHGTNKRPALESVSGTGGLNTKYYMSQTKCLNCSSAKSNSIQTTTAVIFSYMHLRKNQGQASRWKKIEMYTQYDRKKNMMHKQEKGCQSSKKAYKRRKEMLKMLAISIWSLSKKQIRFLYFIKKLYYSPL